MNGGILAESNQGKQSVRAHSAANPAYSIESAVRKSLHVCKYERIVRMCNAHKACVFNVSSALIHQHLSLTPNGRVLQGCSTHLSVVVSQREEAAITGMGHLSPSLR